MMRSGGSNTIAALTMTCGACPAQWEGATEDGRTIYVRFRHGHLGVGFGRNIGEAVDNERTVYEEVGGDRGTMSHAEMLERTGLVLGDGVQIEDGNYPGWGE
jgi:hypothetical protein